MAEYIEREAVLADELTHCLPYSVGKSAGRVIVFAEDIEAIPAADVAPVVRCGKCIHADEKSPHGIICNCPTGGQSTSLLSRDDFCSSGERREA